MVTLKDGDTLHVVDCRKCGGAICITQDKSVAGRRGAEHNDAHPDHHTSQYTIGFQET